MILRRNWAREEAHTPPRTGPSTEACDDLSPNDKVVPPKGLQLRSIKRQEVRIRRGGIRFYIRHTYLDNSRVIGSKV